MNLKILFFALLLFGVSLSAQNQLPDSCKLSIGTNLSGLADWGTEIPFVDLMHTCRTWYTKSIGDPNDPFDSELAESLIYRTDGYPTQLPQTVSGSTYPQITATIWAITDAWPVGQYTVLWEGTGTITFNGTLENLQQTNPHRMVFDITNPIDGAVEMRIEESDSLNPIRNIRVLMPGTEATYETQPFYQLWLDKVDVFQTVRFMDWGQTNGWGLDEDDGFGSDTLVDWDGRSQVDYYTWAQNKGVPYEMMVKFMNDYDKDGWVCVPHSASEDYIRKMAQYFRDNLEPERHIYVEYSNEIWNWIFPQTNWLYEYGCVVPNVDWPEGVAPYVQRMLDYWTDEFSGELDRTTRVVGVFAAWLDVSQRIAFNIDSNTFDAISPTFYFGFNEDIEAELDALGASATVADVADAARRSMPTNFNYALDMKTGVADSLSKPLVFYEGGQHLTPNPFGIEPTYAQALVDIHRDTAMYNMYNEWFDIIRTLQEGSEPLLLMNYAFVGARSAQYGSWGILETMDQDFSVVSAPKYQAILENMNTNCQMVGIPEASKPTIDFEIEPNPTSGIFSLRKISGHYSVTVMDATGMVLLKMSENHSHSIDLSGFPKGMYFIAVESNRGRGIQKVLVE